MFIINTCSTYVITNRMRKNTLLIALMLCFTFGAEAQTTSNGQIAAAEMKAAPHRVIMQLVSGDTLAHKALMHQLKNLKEVWADSVEIEVLVQGPGLDILTKEKTTQSENIYKLKQSGIHFTACEFSLKQRNVKKEDILPEMEFVRYGLVEIIKRQEQGWSYLKAGF